MVSWPDLFLQILSAIITPSSSHAEFPRSQQPIAIAPSPPTPRPRPSPPTTRFRPLQVHELCYLLFCFFRYGRTETK